MTFGRGSRDGVMHIISLARSRGDAFIPLPLPNSGYEFDYNIFHKKDSSIFPEIYLNACLYEIRIRMAVINQSI